VRRKKTTLFLSRKRRKKRTFINRRGKEGETNQSLFYQGKKGGGEKRIGDLLPGKEEGKGKKEKMDDINSPYLWKKGKGEKKKANGLNLPSPKKGGGGGFS